jgi:hypothetical protein
VTKAKKKKSRATTKNSAKKSAKKSKTKKARARAAVAKKAAATRLDSLLEESFPASDPLELTEPGSTTQPSRKRR